MSKMVPGQRWVSDTEPELGLGMLMKAEFGRVEIYFPAATEHRQYAAETAPLRRVAFEPGDTITIHDGTTHVIDTVAEEAGVITYRCADGEIPEAQLSDTISFSKPDERLLSGVTDDFAIFDLRLEALQHRYRINSSSVRGFLGARIDLIPHQMFIASEVASRILPRVLLADEVGLGKTIEACLILHRLHLTGRAGRVLIVVPEPLVHQWFVELFRRFNLTFSIFDEERCVAIEQNQEGAENPFLDSQLVLTSTAFLAGSSKRAVQALEAGWDLLVVDEAHHLEWHVDGPSREYQLVEALARKTPGLLLLTATPQQLGPDGHFARLRLLDPDRYADLAQFLEENEHYGEVAAVVDRILGGKKLSKKDKALFAGKSMRISNHFEALEGGDESARDKLVMELLDEFGTGRVMFRNTRSALSGFPERKALLAPLEGKEQDDFDVRIKWCAELLKDLEGEKLLLICRTRELAEEIPAGIQREVNVKCALFHEDLTLLQRDRNAAFFAEEDGAQVLICSEIGSEGRNFQFAHHLVLFDLPDDPELLEQRIGRLDRIGQTSRIKIHVPYLKGTASEVVARWYHEGLDAFEHNPHGVTEIVKSLRASLDAVCAKYSAEALKTLIADTIEEREAVTLKLQSGHDRLLELNSCRSDKAAAVIENLKKLDGEEVLESFFVRALDQFGVHLEELANRSYLILPGNLVTDAFPALPDEGMTVTLDRSRALSREDIGFMSWDHPLIRSAMDVLLGSETGNSTFAYWQDMGQDAIVLEVVAVLEAVAPASLHVDRFLPPTPVRVAVDHTLKDCSQHAGLKKAKLRKGDVFRLLDKGQVKRTLVPAMVAKATEIATTQLTEVVAQSNATMQATLTDEIERLEDLRAINDHVRPEEIALLKEQRTALADAIGAAHVRIDALRLIWKRDR